jgi:predicted ATP-grasp superfamily ATP-dependent carboligase
MSALPPAVVLNLYYHGGVGVVRTLGRLGVAVHAVHRDASVPAARSRYVRELVEWDTDARDPEATVERLLSLGRRLGERAVLVVCHDAGQAFVDTHAHRLSARFTFPHRDPELTRRLISKRGLFELCREHGVPTPEAAFPRDRDEVRAALEDAAFPLVLKPIDSGRFSARHGIRMVIARDAAEALDAWDRFAEPGDPNLMLQEHLPGESSSVWVFTGYFDAQAELVFGAGGTKLRQYPVDTGTTCFGDVRREPELELTVRRFVKRLGYHGVFDCGFRRDPRDGRYKLLDVNPRVGANFRQCVGRRGLDVVRAMYLDLAGHPVPHDVAAEGRTWWVENYDAAGALELRRAGRLPLRGWLASLRRVDEPAWFDVRDPAPFAAMIGASALAARRRTRAGPGPSAGDPVLKGALDGRVESVEPV